jgi:hypothetical protein
MPPGSFAAAPPGPVSYPMPPSSLGAPQLPPSAGGYLGAPPPTTKKKVGKLPFVIVGVVLLVFAGCCGSLYAFGSQLKDQSGSSSGGGPGARPTRSFDKSKPPPPVTELRAALVSVGDIAAVMSTPADKISTKSDTSLLQGGLSNLMMCAEGAVAGDAIAGTETNSFKVSIRNDSYSVPSYEPYAVSSAVAGFYSDEAKVYFAALRDKAGRCGWSEMQAAKLGEDTLGIFVDDGAKKKVAIVFVRTGQVVSEVAVTGVDDQGDTRGSYQSDAIKLATAMAKRLPQT